MATAKKRGDSWRIRKFSHVENGKKIYVSFTAPTKKEAELMASKFVKGRETPVTFKEAGDRYIESKLNTLSPNTIRTYKIIQKRLGDLNNIRLDRISNETVQRVINQLSATLSSKTVHSTYGFVTAVFGMYSPETVLHVRLPEKKPPSALIPTDNDVLALINCTEIEELQLAIKLAAFGSLRSGEACALRSDCVFDKYIRIKRNYVLTENGDWIIKESPKTYAGYRDIPLPEDIMALIRRNIKPDGTILHYTPSSLHDAFRRLTRASGLPPFKFHSLRHYFATFCHAQNIPDQYIMKLGGWDDISTLTKIYQHTMPEKMDDVVEIINRYYESMTTNMTKKNEGPAK